MSLDEVIETLDKLSGVPPAAPRKRNRVSPPAWRAPQPRKGTKAHLRATRKRQRQARRLARA